MNMGRKSCKLLPNRKSFFPRISRINYNETITKLEKLDEKYSSHDDMEQSLRRKAVDAEYIRVQVLGGKLRYPLNEVKQCQENSE